MIITPAATIAGHRVTETLGLVRGNTIRARHLGRDIVAGRFLGLEAPGLSVGIHPRCNRDDHQTS